MAIEYRLEDLPKVMTDRDGWRKRESQGIHDNGTTVVEGY